MLPRALVVVLLVTGCGPKSEGGEAGSTSSSTTSAGTTTATSASTAIDPTSGEADTSAATTGTDDDPCPGPNNHLEQDKCFCDDGYLWCDPFDPDDLSCCLAGAGTSSEGTSSGESSSGDSSTGEPAACDAPPPDGCDPAVEAMYCQQAPGCALEGSVIYWCDGAWQPDEAATTKLCEDQGEAFAFGCEVVDGAVVVSCGHGPGTACVADDPAFCTDVTILQACTFGKLAEIDCVAACKAGEVDGVVHDSGFCVQSRISSSCACCDDPDCP